MSSTFIHTETFTHVPCDPISAMTGTISGVRAVGITWTPSTCLCDIYVESQNLQGDKYCILNWKLKKGFSLVSSLIGIKTSETLFRLADISETKM